MLRRKIIKLRKGDGKFRKKLSISDRGLGKPFQKRRLYGKGKKEL